MFVQQSFLSIFFCFFNPIRCYGNQWRLFSSNLPGMFVFWCLLFQQYIHVLSRPMVIEREYQYKWTNVYMDVGSAVSPLKSTLSIPPNMLCSTIALYTLLIHPNYLQISCLNLYLGLIFDNTGGGGREKLHKSLLLNPHFSGCIIFAAPPPPW